jgi:hypothetical protein
MKKYVLGIVAILLAVSFTTLSAFSESRKREKAEQTVRFFKDGAWSTVNETLTDAVQTSNCPDEGGIECARFYDINHLNLTSNPITVKTNPATMQPYDPDLILRYDL